MTDGKALIHTIVHHDLDLLIVPTNGSPGCADLTVSADGLSITVQRLSPTDLRDMAAALLEYAGRLEGG